MNLFVPNSQLCKIQHDDNTILTGDQARLKTWRDMIGQLNMRKVAT